MTALLRSYGWALLSGVLLSWSLPTFHWYPLAWIALVPLLAHTLHMPPKFGAAQCFVAGWIFHSIALQWLTANIFWAGGWALLGQQVICLALAGYWAILGALWCGLNQRWPGLRAAGVFALCWISMEWLQARLFTGFAWAALGYGQGPDIWFSQLASIGGVIFLSGLLVLVNGLVAQALHTPALRWRALAMALVVLLVSHGAGYILLGPDTRNESTFAAGLYQSNYSQQMKWDPDYKADMLDRALAQSGAVLEEEPASLFVWPEALVLNDFRDADVLAALQAFAGSTQTPLFAGTVRSEGGKSFNSSVLVRPDGTYEWYDKMKLAPFGEYIPMESVLSFVETLGAGGGMAAGTDPRVLEAGGRHFGPLICFEVLFSPLASKRRAMGADMLVVVTNLGWFGLSNVLAQELEIARFRAIENRLPLVQCANTGVSGVFDAYGRLAVIDGLMTTRGGYRVWRSPPEPTDAMVHRRVGVLPVGDAATMLLPGSVDWFGRITPLITLAILVGGFARNRNIP